MILELVSLQSYVNFSFTSLLSPCLERAQVALPASYRIAHRRGQRQAPRNATGNDVVEDQGPEAEKGTPLAWLHTSRQPAFSTE